MRFVAARLTPDAIDWWIRLRELTGRLGQVHRWLAAEHPPTNGDPHHALHAVTTSVLCLHGVARLSDGRRRIDLSPGDAVIIQPGAWHRHEPLRRGSVVFQQGVNQGCSDFWFASDAVQLVGSVPEQPSHRLLDQLAATADDTRRRNLLSELLGNLVRESVEPLRPVEPAVARMNDALWRLVGTAGTADEIIRAAGIGRVQAYKLFTRHHGQPPATVLRQDRLILARSLLAAGLPVAEVATRCGFASRQVFSRAYRRAFAIAAGRPGRRHESR